MSAALQRFTVYACGVASVLLATTPAQAWQQRPRPVVIDVAPETPSAATTKTPSAASAPATATSPSAAPPSERSPSAGESASEVGPIRPASLNGVTPGKTKIEEVAANLGEARATRQDKQREVRTYRVGNFPKVEVTFDNGVVATMIAQLQMPAPAADVVRELNLEKHVPATVLDADEALIGWSFPERGLTLIFADEKGPPRVVQIMLDTISAEPFLLRALHDTKGRLQHDLADLAAAEERGNRDPRLFARRAELLQTLGNYPAALAISEDALRLDPQNADVRLTKASILGELGRQEEAIALAKVVVTDSASAVLARARGEFVLAQLFTQGPQPKIDQALEHHRAAIKLAAPLASDSHASIRRAAKTILVNSHLGIALDIAGGDFQNKREAVTKWLRKGAELADPFQTDDGGPADLRLHVFCQILTAYGLAGSSFDPAPTAEAALQEGRELIAASGDELQQHQLEWNLGLALMEAAILQRDRHKPDEALALADNGAALLASAAATREVTPQRDYALARSFYAIGSIQAICRNDHEEASKFYDKALALIADPLPASATAHLDRHGEILASMGVSFWATGQRERALHISEAAVKYLQEGVQHGQCEATSLAIPFDNLATMHRALGNPDQAQHCLELARRNAPPPPAGTAPQTTRR